MEEVDDNHYVILKNINKYYDGKVHAVTDFNLNIKKHEFIVFVGPSGCGKSTTLRMVAGLEDITSGELYIDGTYCNDLPPSERDIAMVFQSYALYPNMTVYDNMAFSLKIKHLDPKEIDKRVHEAAKILEIEEYLDRKPKALSGGQRQRVALGRAIVRKARLFLMDEPLSNLDAKLRVQMRSEIIKLHERLEATTIYVTHDQTEAMTMADRIVVMKNGFVQQIDTPIEIYRHPANKFVASFIGSPAMNFADGIYDHGVVKFDDGTSVTLSKEQVKRHDEFYKTMYAEEKEHFASFVEDVAKRKEEILPKKKKATFVFDPENDEEVKAKKEAIEFYRSVVEDNVSHKIIFGVRPESIVIDEKGSLKIKVDLSELLGDQSYVHFNFANNDFLAKISTENKIVKDQELTLSMAQEKTHLFDFVSEKSIY